jgi:hypothetical protein
MASVHDRDWWDDSKPAPMNQRIGSLVHLPGRGPVNLDASSLRFFREQAEQVAEAPVEQRLEIPLLRAVGEEL